uniref:GH92 family glycosyl hydrolase n=2 Tax=uncultured Duncaniella sp. TaxID=2768039 RepID=UPI00349FAC4E
NLSGVGCPELGSLLLMPTTGELNVDYKKYGSKYKDEQASPGYYSNYLTKYNVKTETTATPRTGITRFTFPKGKSHVLLNLGEGLTNETGAMLRRVNDCEVAGMKLLGTFCYNPQAVFPIYFVMRVNKIPAATGYWKKQRPMTGVEAQWDSDNGKYKLYTKYGKEIAGDDVGAYFSFDTEEGEQIEVRIGVSFVSIENARLNLDKEQAEKSFETVHADARAKWNGDLSRITVEGGTDDQKTVFYTALYHLLIHPNILQDVNGEYPAMESDKILTTKGDRYTVFSLWDTYRAFHPLMTIIDTDRNNDYINSLLTKYQEGGLLPMWELAGNYTATMTGYHAVSVMADALSKGISNFDPELAYKAAVRSAVWDTTGIVTPELVKKALMPKSKEYKNTLGFIPWDKEHESVAKGLEYAYDDWCISLLAEAAGDSAGVEEYKAKGQAYRHYFDPVTRFMRGRDEKGNWHLPFNPRSSNHREDDYCEGTAWQWTWYVPHDVEGLIGLMGGNEKFVEKLDSLFTADSSLEGDLVSADISGLIGQYAHGNEPSHHILHLYNYAGEPWKTQELVDQVMKEQYRNDVDGLSGNEDCGQMSSWYVLNSLGFYQVAPGKPVYSIGRPWFREASVNMPNGKNIEISVENFSKENKYIESVTLDGEPLDSPFFTHDQIRNGAKFHYVMSDKPTRWGVKK